MDDFERVVVTERQIGMALDEIAAKIRQEVADAEMVVVEGV